MAKKKISAETQQELVVAIGARYRAAGKPDKLRILDEFVAVTGYHPPVSGLLSHRRPDVRGVRPTLGASSEMMP